MILAGLGQTKEARAARELAGIVQGLGVAGLAHLASDEKWQPILVHEHGGAEQAEHGAAPGSAAGDRN
jgi:hypothetical protein